MYWMYRHLGDWSATFALAGGDVAQVERRILPHQHDVDVFRQIDLARLTQRVVVAFHPLHGRRFGQRGERAILPRQRSDVVVEQRVAPRVRRKHQRKSRIAADLEVGERVHLDRNAQGHRHSIRL